jgi:hypothetical protein
MFAETTLPLTSNLLASFEASGDLDVDLELQAETIMPKMNNENEQSRNLFFIVFPQFF